MTSIMTISIYLLTRPAYLPPETCRRGLSLVDSTSESNGYALSLAMLGNVLLHNLRQ